MASRMLLLQALGQEYPRTAELHDYGADKSRCLSGAVMLGAENLIPIVVGFRGVLNLGHDLRRIARPQASACQSVYSKKHAFQRNLPRVGDMGAGFVDMSGTLHTCQLSLTAGQDPGQHARESWIESHQFSRYVKMHPST